MRRREKDKRLNKMVGYAVYIMCKCVWYYMCACVGVWVVGDGFVCVRFDSDWYDWED